MDREEKWIDINIDGEDDESIGYNYDSLDGCTSNSDDNFEDHLINAWEREFYFRREKKN